MEQITTSISIEEQTILNLFNLPFLDTPNGLSLISKKTKKVKDNFNSFGVFVSIHRNSSKLKDYPEDIHGCIGYWNNSFQSLSQQELFDNIMRVSKDALLTNDRRNYFPPIETDVLSTVEISYMMKPIYEIDPETGIILNSNQNSNSNLNNKNKREVFNNNKYGLIVSSSNSTGFRATFLPKVFENIDWQGIKSKILSKAGISQNSNSNSSHIKYYAYKTQVKTIKIFDIISKNNYPRILIKTFRDFIEKTLKDKYIPYNIKSNVKSNRKSNININSNKNKENPQIIYDETEEIRNLSVLETFIKSYSIFNSSKLKSEKTKNFKNYNKETPGKGFEFNLINFDNEIQKVINYSLSKIDVLNNQTLANLISAIITYYKVYELLYKQKPNLKLKLKSFDVPGVNNQNNNLNLNFILNLNLYIKKLLEGIEKAERKFERGQIILALIDYYIYVGKSKQEELLNLIDLTIELYKTPEKVKIDEKVEIDEVFRLNWDSQVFTKIFHTLNLKYLLNNKTQNEKINLQKKVIPGYVLSNLKIYLKLFEKMTNEEMEQLETNYLAVSFEGLMNLLSCLKIEKHQVILSICFKLFLEIMKRYDTKTGLIKFKDGNSRIDIMCHFINPFTLFSKKY